MGSSFEMNNFPSPQISSQFTSSSQTSPPIDLRLPLCPPPTTARNPASQRQDRTWGPSSDRFAAVGPGWFAPIHPRISSIRKSAEPRDAKYRQAESKLPLVPEPKGQGRPQCQRCIKYGVQCPGYRDDDGMRFQNADPTSFERRKKKRNHQHQDQDDEAALTTNSRTGTLQIIEFTPELSTAASISTSASPGSSRQPSRQSTPATSVTTDTTTSTQLSVALPVLKTIRQHWTAESIPLVLGFYESLDFLPGLFRGAGQNHCLVLTGQVFTRAYMINKFRPRADYRELSIVLGHALAAVQEAIRNPKTYTSDSTIVAVWLLGNYELMIGGLERRSFITNKERGSSPEVPWHIHGQGLLSLMRARGDRQLYTRSGRQIFWVMHNMIQVQLTIANTPCPPDFERWLDIIEATLQPSEGLLLHTARYLSAACSLLSKLIPLTLSGDASRARAAYPALIAESDRADLAMAEWMHAAPEFQFEPGPMWGYFWNSWRSARIKVHHMIILISNLVEYGEPSLVPEDYDVDCGGCPLLNPEVLHARREFCMGIIATAGRDVVEGIPRSLGGKMPDLDPDLPSSYFDGVRLIWPLSHLYILPTAPRHLRIVARDALLRIAKEKGILTALKPRAGGMLFPEAALRGIPVDNLEDVIEGGGGVHQIATKVEAQD
ncbi:hypothetical protein CABS01_02774 [Colletotrichum abscissum]|uniref:uncharacterized protein n=1 Tax=Colletotrichum abscissum TaxID=1671311 RepID=UPI0027D56D1F|nr:uncharacterized protein CABS01_02774 [Colletotrichum abscissum]KAK1483038.1 hypothetical protein CABS01_02774 [Colletotrichum abscissum]